MRLLAAGTVVLLAAPLVAQQDANALRLRIAALENELALARAELAAQSAEHPTATGPPAEVSATSKRPEPTLESPPEDDRIRFGDFSVGGAMRVNWTLGDYETGARGPSRGGHGGDVSLDTFRLNLDYARGPWVGKAEYRWYPGTKFFHTLEFGYTWSEVDTVRAGLTRVPFGVGPYGPANSWFFDQHYYVGLADDMDIGITHTAIRGDWTLDMGLFVTSPPNARGDSTAGARYSFDLVDAAGDPAYFGNRTPTRYAERGQLNLRIVRTFRELPAPTELGLSLQYGRLVGRGDFDDARPWAGSLHTRSTLGPWTLMLQATRYDYDSEEDHITGGFYDYTTDIASRGTLLSAALSYTWDAPVAWLDAITFYNDFSVIRKHTAGFHSSSLNVLGAAFSRGGWYIYADWARSDGNEFVGDFRPGMWADNADRTWQTRYNLNLGYYF